jgi:trigger factor
MQITMSEVQNLQAQITLVMQPEDYQEQVEKEIRQLRQKAQIPGFRAGNVPKGLIRKMYGKNVLADVINKELGTALQKYIDEQKLHVLGEPLPNEEQNQKVDLEFDSTFTFVFDVALAPELDTKMTAKNKVTYYRVKVTDEMVNNQVNNYADRYGTYQDVDEVQENDIVRGNIKENKEDGISKEDAVIYPRYMKDEEIKKQFLGLKKGGNVVFNPMKAFDSETEVASLLGIDKEVAKQLTTDFTFTIATISRHQSAAIDGELFAKIYGENNIKDEADFREHVRQEIQSNMDQDSDYKFGLDVREALMKKVEKAELPQDFLRRWVKVNNEKMTDEELESDYKYDYGYGHGYHRFAAILGQLECYRDTEKKDYYTRMPESAALVILRSVVQNSYTSAAGTSMTQYSAIYNNEKKTVEVWPFQNYSKSFTFDVEGNQISSDQ